MNKILAIFLFVVIPLASHAATCSRINFNRCLDSVCAINIGANPSARCQLCGDGAAGAFTARGQNVLSGGQYKLNPDDAPSDPGARYAWATEQCIKLVDGCGENDADEYDKLIEQSCRAVCVNASIIASQTAAMTAGKSAGECLTEIGACVTDSARCNADYSKCEDGNMLDTYISQCGVTAGNLCAPHMSGIRTKIAAARDGAVSGRAGIVEKLVAAYRAKRTADLDAKRAGCAGHAARDNCIETVCASNMPGKCADGDERAAATLMCEYVDTACERLK